MSEESTPAGRPSNLPTAPALNAHRPPQPDPVDRARAVALAYDANGRSTENNWGYVAGIGFPHKGQYYVVLPTTDGLRWHRRPDPSPAP